MTNWLPDIELRSGPLYCRIADSIEDAIGEGALAPGEKLPPQRNLAYDIGVTIGTVSRAYALARERGLVSGEIGRGTYVSAHAESAARMQEAELPSKGVPLQTGQTTDMIRLDSTAAPDVGQAAYIGAALAGIVRDHPFETIDYIRKIPQSWKEAGRTWLASHGWQAETGNVVPTLGVHAAAMAIIASVTGPGDRIAMEELSYASVARGATAIGRRIVTVAADSEGFDPAEFEAVCAQQHPRLVFLSSSTANPTGITMPANRRAAVAEIANRYNVWLIDDMIYDSLARQPVPPMAVFAPERTFTISGLSKSVAAGLRAGWAACPPHMAERVLAAQKLITGGKPFLISELAARLVLNGEADLLRDRVGKEVAARVEIASRMLDGLEFSRDPRCPFLWVELPEPWKSSEFRHAAANVGVLVDDEDEFKTARLDRAFYRFRIGLTQPASRERMSDGLMRLRRLLDSGVTAHDSYT